MKIVKGLLAVLIAAIVSTSCSKDKQGNNKGIEGIWEGKWGGIGEEPSNFIRFEVKKNGGLTRLSEQNQVIANGNWSLNGIEFEASYTHTANGEKHRMVGLYTDFNGMIIGNWGFYPSKANGGTLDLLKK